MAWLNMVRQSQMERGHVPNDAEVAAEFFDTNVHWECAAAESESDERVTLPRRMLRAFVRPGGVAVDLGGGAGLDTLFLATSGMTVHYVDVSSKLAEACRGRLERAGLLDRVIFHKGDWASAEIPAQSCDLAIAMGESPSFAVSPSSRKDFFRVVSNAVRAGGRALVTVDSLYGRVLAHIRAGRMERALAVLGSQLDQEVSTEFPVYCYTAAELEALLQEAGFESVNSIAFPILVAEVQDLNLRLGQIPAFECAAKNLLTTAVKT